MINKVLAIDMDDVLKDFNTELFAFYNSLHNTDHHPRNATSYSLQEAWGCSSEQMWEAVNLFYDSPQYDEVMPIEGAIEGIEQLKKFYTLHVITARACLHREITVAWLERHFPRIFQGVHLTTTCINGKNDGTGHTRKKSEVCHEIGAKILIDDSLVNAIDAAYSGITVLMMDKPWNQKKHLHPNIIRVETWKEITKYLLRWIQ